MNINLKTGKKKVNSSIQWPPSILWSLGRLETAENTRYDLVTKRTPSHAQKVWNKFSWPILILAFSYLLRLWLQTFDIQYFSSKSQWKSCASLFIQFCPLARIPLTFFFFFNSNFLIVWEFYAVEFPLTLRRSLSLKYTVNSFLPDTSESAQKILA